MANTGADAAATIARRIEIFTGAGGRRRWSAEDKARILSECAVPGARVSAVARSHGLLASQIFRWRRDAARKARDAMEFAPVVLAPANAAMSAGASGQQPDRGTLDRALISQRTVRRVRLARLGPPTGTAY